VDSVERRRALTARARDADQRAEPWMAWEPTQSGTWGPSLFTYANGAFQANSADFAEFDAMKVEFGL
jgi:arabinogalactan endo-1,4-beta-galactosidase